MAQIIYQDRTYTLPDGSIEGEELLQELEVPQDHDLVLMRPEGNLLVGRYQRLHPVDGDRFVDAPIFKYGT
jgi:hypothetical protein